MTGVDQLIATEKAGFVAGLRKIDPALSAWAEERLGEGFTVDAVKDALRKTVDSVRPGRGA